MKGIIRKFSAAAAILLALAWLAPGGSAQAAGPATAPVQSTRAEWVGVGDALLQTAAQAPGSEESCVALLAAANAYRAGGRLSYARRVALQAASRARQAGFAVTAARAYLAAATLSEDLNQPEVAQEYFAKCRQLADLNPRLRRHPVPARGMAG